MSYGYTDPNQGYPQQPYGQPPSTGYAPSPYGAQPQPVVAQPYAVVALPDHPQATTVLVLGIIGFFLFPLCGPFAWYFGSQARKEIREHPGVYKEGGSLTVGWILGIIDTIYLALLIVLGILYVIFFVILIGAGVAGNS